MDMEEEDDDVLLAPLPASEEEQSKQLLSLPQKYKNAATPTSLASLGYHYLHRWRQAAI